MAKSNGIIKDLKNKLGKLASTDISDEDGKIQFLRELLAILNGFFFEKRKEKDIEDLESSYYRGKSDTLPAWKRHTEFLAIWDDYSEKILSFMYPDDQITALAKRLNKIFENANLLRTVPDEVDPDVEDVRFGSMTGREFSFIRIIHALQDFTQLLPEIDSKFANKLKDRFGRIPMPKDLKDREQALEFVTVLGGADRNVDERTRYITDVCDTLIDKFEGDAFLIFDKCDGNVKTIYDVLTTFTGIASKKANMILRDFYEYGL